MVSTVGITINNRPAETILDSSQQCFKASLLSNASECRTFDIIIKQHHVATIIEMIFFKIYHDMVTFIRCLHIIDCLTVLLDIKTCLFSASVPLLHGITAVLTHPVVFN